MKCFTKNFFYFSVLNVFHGVFSYLVCRASLPRMPCLFAGEKVACMGQFAATCAYPCGLLGKVPRLG